MSAEWKGKVSVDGAKQAEGDLKRVGKATSGAALQMKSLAGTMSGAMGLFHGLRGVLAGDATAMVNVATGASMLWRAASQLHPALRIVAIAGTALVAVWPKIGHYFKSAAQQAEQLKQSLINAGVVLTGYAKATADLAKLSADMDREKTRIDAIAEAWKAAQSANAEYADTVSRAKLAVLDAGEQRELMDADDDPRQQAEIRGRYGRKRAEVKYESDVAAIKRREAELQDNRDSAGSDAAGKRIIEEKAKGVVGEARAKYTDAVIANNQAGGRDEELVKALKDAAAAYRDSIAKFKDAETDRKASEVSLAGADSALKTFSEKTKPAALDLAEQERKDATAKADADLLSADKAHYKDIDAARAEDAQFEEEERFGNLSVSDQRKELDTKIAEQQKSLDSMSDSDPAKAKAIRDLTSLKRRRASLAPEEGPEEGFDAFLSDRAKQPGGPQLSDTKRARGFRSKLGPKFADKLTASAFGKGGKEGDSRSAEEKLVALQEKSVEYQKIIAERIQGVALKE